MASKNAQTARNGFQAEREMCVDPDVKHALEQYFQKPILSIQKIERKKYDLEVRFEDGITTLQNKDGEGKGQGWSVDRRSIDLHPEIKTLFQHMCLTPYKNRPDFTGEMPNAEISRNIMTRCFLGEDPPKYFTHTLSNKSTQKILSMGICSTDDFMTFMYGKIHPIMNTKRTRIYLSPHCCIQRKGATKTDKRADDAQLKFTYVEEMKDLFMPIFHRTDLLD